MPARPVRRPRRINPQIAQMTKKENRVLRALREERPQNSEFRTNDGENRGDAENAEA